MELKIKIKEVKEERRLLTDEEECFITVMNIPRWIPSFQKEATELLRKRGFETGDGQFGVFRKETIRDATPEEYRAWTYLQLVKHCACPERKISSLDCNDCFLSGVCVASDFKTKIAIYILKGKEVILELV